MGLGIGLGLGVCAAGAGSFSPLTLPGLFLWLRSDKGIHTATGVSQWDDQSGSGNTFVQGTGANQPTLNASDANFNGRPSLNFNGSSQLLTIASMNLGASPQTAFFWAVVRINVSGSVTLVFCHVTASSELRMVTGGFPRMLAGGASASWSGASVTGVTKAIYGYDLGTSQVDGVNVSNGTENTGVPSSHAISNNTNSAIGAQPAGAAFSNMALAEIIGCSYPSAGNRAALQAYAVAIYGSV